MVNFFPESPLLILILLPALSGVVLWAIPSEKKNWIRWFAILISSIVLVLSVGIFVVFDSEVGGIQFQSSYNWLDMPGSWGDGSGAFALSLGVDGIAVMMVLLTGIVMFTGTIVSWTIETDSKDFFCFIFSFTFRSFWRFCFPGFIFLFLLL